MQKENLIEFQRIRESYGGSDGQAINRHNVRYYAFQGKLYMLDRETDTDRSFSLSEIRTDSNGRIVQGVVAPTVVVNGQKDWGQSMSWNKAELTLIKYLGASTIQRDNKVCDLKGKII